MPKYWLGIMQIKVIVESWAGEPQLGPINFRFQRLIQLRFCGGFVALNKSASRFWHQMIMHAAQLAVIIHVIIKVRKFITVEPLLATTSDWWPTHPYSLAVLVPH